MIESTIYNRLILNTDITGLVTAIRTNQPEVNQQVPYLVYTVVGQATNTYTSGQSSLTKYTFTVDGYTVDESELVFLMNEVKESLNGWRGGNVLYCSLQDERQDKQENHHHGQHVYDLWFKLANITMALDSKL